MRKRSGKKPVLTSPWKIGMLVSLLCLVVGFGVSYYFVSVHGIKLEWLSVGEGRFNVAVDSLMFFRQMYPLVAGVMALSLVSYFVIASAVRRYKYYLASGQDYRKMISLAESIDDLTNPAQIARLSDFPELQSVLRNYGDQIREIAQELDQKSTGTQSVDLEMEIESLLNGDSVQETLIEGKWWKPLFDKIKDNVNESRRTIEELRTAGESHRQLFGQAVLTLGKSIEVVGQSSEDLVEIVNAVGEINSATRNAGARGGTAGGAGTADTIIESIEIYSRNLQEGGRVLHEFSEENNGIALNMALAAAKGGVRDQDLAQFAEKVRVTAERFNKFNATVASIAEGLLGGCFKLREHGNGGQAAGGGVDLDSSLLNLCGKIEKHAGMLQERFCELGSDIQDLHRAFRQSKGQFAVREEDDLDAAVEAGSDPGFVNFGADGRSDSGDGEELVLDRSKTWGDDESADVTGDDRQDVVDAAEDAPMEMDTAGERDASPAEPAEEKRQTADGEMESGQAEGEASKDPGESPAADSGGWMQMPGHRWLKIDVEQGEPEADHEGAAVDVLSETARKIGMETVAGESARDADHAAGIDGFFPGITPESGIASAPGTGPETEEPVEAEDGRQDGEEKDPIYDLFELGAVEYVEEPKS